MGEWKTRLTKERMKMGRQISASNSAKIGGKPQVVCVSYNTFGVPTPAKSIGRFRRFKVSTSKNPVARFRETAAETNMSPEASF
jgi:hypothetical protein